MSDSTSAMEKNKAQKGKRVIEETDYFKYESEKGVIA